MNTTGVPGSAIGSSSQRGAFPEANTNRGTGVQDPLGAHR
jgi:hypothetical protein